MKIVILDYIEFLDVFTEIGGHGQYFPIDDFNDCFMEENPVTEYEDAWEILNKEGFWEWAILPDGSYAISDYGRKPIMDILTELDDFPTSEEMIIAINRCLDVVHQRGDLASAFIEGGSKSCWEISNT